jgi:hypothetical protein
MTADVAANVNAGSTAPTGRACWITVARLAWPVVTILALTANFWSCPSTPARC